MAHQLARVEVARVVLIEVRRVDVAREGREQAEVLAGQGPHQARGVSDADLIKGAVDDEVIAHGVDPAAARAGGWCQAGSMSRVFATSGARGDSGSEVSGPRLKIRDTTARARSRSALVGDNLVRDRTALSGSSCTSSACSASRE